jgi:hypothetical protein
LDKEPVGRDLHAVLDLDDVADEDLGLVEAELFAVSPEVDHFSGLGELVQEGELFLFLVVVDGGDTGG